MEALRQRPALDCVSVNAVVLTDACPGPAIGPHALNANGFGLGKPKNEKDWEKNQGPNPEKSCHWWGSEPMRK